MQKNRKIIRKSPSPKRTRHKPFRNSQSLTVGQVLRYLAPNLAAIRFVYLWPPDIFAVAASILQKCGEYILLVSDWPPDDKYRKRPKLWIRDIRRIARKWRKACVSSRRPPREISGWWKCVLDHQALRLNEVCKNRAVLNALLQLCAAADETSSGLGVPSKRKRVDPLRDRVRNYIVKQPDGASTLCKSIHKSKLRVLPKLHTPQSGITIRSISHHLAVCPSGDVETGWYFVPHRPQEHCLNLLLIPWPGDTTPNHFRMSEGTLRNMPAHFGFFAYDRPVRSTEPLCKKTKALLIEANRIVGRIDGVILPELALNSLEQWDLRNIVSATGAFLLCGVRQASVNGQPGRNYLSLDVPLSGNAYTSYEQDKHHRWLLDKRQIVQYGLGARLDPSRSWWEYMKLRPRKLSFFAMRPWLTLCALICEDLARQDPVTEIVRAVGPNLVVALLMDGPQLISRWPARYATVLADDPGSSVLTLTSSGMTQLSRPPEVGMESSRIVGLWKDAITGLPIPVELPNGADGIVLSLVAEHREEWTADGRSDHGASGYPVFGGVHPIHL